MVVGAGGMGVAIARRLGAARPVLLADINPEMLAAAVASVQESGCQVTGQVVDVADGDSVAELASVAAGLGSVVDVAHTAGLSPVQASATAVLRVDLFGVAAVLDAFGAIIAEGGAGVVIASMAGHMMPLPPEQEQALLKTPTKDLLGLPFLSADAVTDSGLAYVIAKRANALRVKAAAAVWGARGARINSISPGVIATPMGQAELASETGDAMRAMLDMSAAQRIGTPEDIADAATFLLGPSASYITGTDLLVDGGVVAAIASA